MPKVLVHVDHKTGKWHPGPPGKSLQLLSGAIALARRWGCDAIRVGYYFPRDGAYEWWPSETGYLLLSSPEADRILGEVRDAALLDETPRPGPHCAACWERRACAHSPVS